MLVPARASVPGGTCWALCTHCYSDFSAPRHWDGDGSSDGCRAFCSVPFHLLLSGPGLSEGLAVSVTDERRRHTVEVGLLCSVRAQVWAAQTPSPERHRPRQASPSCRSRAGRSAASLQPSEAHPAPPCPAQSGRGSCLL